MPLSLFGALGSLIVPLALGPSPGRPVPAAIPRAGVETGLETAQVAHQIARAPTSCRTGPVPGSRESRLWSQARAALNEIVIAQRSSPLTYKLLVRERRLEPEHLRVLSESTRRLIVVGGAGAGADSGDATHVAPRGPPLATLLDPRFPADHCFAVRASEPGMAELIGLVFSPGDTAAADVAGTLWLDATSDELLELELSVPGDSMGAPDASVTYQAWFRSLRDGTPLTARWRMRVPLRPASIETAADAAGEPDARVGAIREVVVEVTAVHDGTGHALLPEAFPVLHGQVYDSTRAAPLVGARVALLGTERVALTDDAGRFIMSGLPTGRYTVEVTHPRMDSVGVAWLHAETTLERGDVVYGDFALPPLTSIADGACPREPGTARAGTVLGHISGAGTGPGGPGARVIVGWTQRDDNASGHKPARHDIRLLEWATPAGHYLLCGIPTNRAVRLWAVAPAALSDTLTLRLSAGEVRPASLRLRPVPAGALRGQVVDRVSRRPLAGAHVDLSALGLRVTTAQDGRFAFDALPVGEYVLSAAAPGYTRAIGRVGIRRNETTMARLSMTPSSQASAHRRPPPR